MTRINKQPIPQRMKDKVLERDGHACRYCGTTEGPFHMDHVYPESKGGETSVNNLVTSCRRCNLKKHNKIGQWPWPVFVEPVKVIPARSVRTAPRMQKEIVQISNALLMVGAAFLFYFYTGNAKPEFQWVYTNIQLIGFAFIALSIYPRIAALNAHKRAHKPAPTQGETK